MADIASNTEIQIATDSVFSTIVSDDSGPYRTSKAFVKGDLPYGVTLFARMRHTHASWGNSPWSASLEFQVIVPATIIGICLDNSGTKGVFYWIDALGNKLDMFDFTTHPTYKSISMATVDDRAPVTMTKIPTFYVKTAVSGPVGTFADGKKCWWLSDLKALGYRPAACFKRSTLKDAAGKFRISDAVYIGTYLAHTETVGGATCLGSKKGTTPQTAQAKSTSKTSISNRNSDVAGITGFRMFDIWDMGALRLLLLMAIIKSDVQTNWGDNSTNISAPATGATEAKAIFKGTVAAPQVFIDDLWKCYWYYADLISITNGIVSLASPIDLTAAVSFGSADVARYTTPSTTGWIRDVLDCPMTIGDDTHDLMELFLPKAVATAETQATFSDSFGMNDAAAEIFFGGSANFTETYQNYEQTGTTSQSISFYNLYGIPGCPNYYNIGGTSCCRISNNSLCYRNYCEYMTSTSVPVYGYVTRTKTTNLTTEPGIFAMNKGLKFPSLNTGTYAARVCKN